MQPGLHVLLLPLQGDATSTRVERPQIQGKARASFADNGLSPMQPK
jgi:hypothetical protein